MLQEAHPSTSQPQVVEDESPAGEATKAYFSCLMENYKNTWMQERSFFAWREKPIATQLRKIGLKPAQMSQVVTYAKKQDQVPKLLLTIQFVRSPKDLKRSRRAIRLTENVKTYLKRIPQEGEETGKKASAADVCSCIRVQRNGSGSGRKIFAKEEWLVADQIAQYFSRLSVLYRSGRLAVNPDTT